MEEVEPRRKQQPRATQGVVAGMAEALETQEQFPVRAGIQDLMKL
jgi:hypothetical protein